jgi:nucleotide-binding universal stress UspA family protein
VFSLTRILVPTNLGEPSRSAIRYGIAFARQFNARLFLVHVLSTQEYESAIEAERVIETLMPEAVPEGARTDATPESLARNAAREELSQLIGSEDARATNAEYIIRADDSRGAGDAIVDCAAELEVELIVMGKHRLGFVEHLLAGSVTEKVVRHAPCPVLIVQHPEHEFVIPDDT